MAVVIRLQGLPIVAGTMDIRHFFSGLTIPDGGVHIVGGELGEAFIVFATDEDARLEHQKHTDIFYSQRRNCSSKYGDFIWESNIQLDRSEYSLSNEHSPTTTDSSNPSNAIFATAAIHSPNTSSSSSTNFASCASCASHSPSPFCATYDPIATHIRNATLESTTRGTSTCWNEWLWSTYESEQ
ncbi:RNA-binding protein 12 [Sigmodon hispidus]